MQTQKLKSLQEDCESERQDLQHQLSSLNDEIDRWGRQTEERNYMLSNRIEKEVENRKVLA